MVYRQSILYTQAAVKKTANINVKKLVYQEVMETTPPDKEGRSDLPSELGFALAPRETDSAPVVTRSSEVSCVEPTSTMVTRSRAREGRGISVILETQFEPETGTQQEQEIQDWFQCQQLVR